MVNRGPIVFIPAATIRRIHLLFSSLVPIPLRQVSRGKQREAETLSAGRQVFANQIKQTILFSAKRSRNPACRQAGLARSCLMLSSFCSFVG